MSFNHCTLTLPNYVLSIEAVLSAACEADVSVQTGEFSQQAIVQVSLKGKGENLIHSVMASIKMASQIPTGEHFTICDLAWQHLVKHSHNYHCHIPLQNTEKPLTEVDKVKMFLLAPSKALPQSC